MDGRAARCVPAEPWRHFGRTGNREDVGQDTIACNRVGCSNHYYFGLNHFSGRPVNDTTILMAANDGMRRAESMVIIRRWVVLRARRL